MPNRAIPRGPPRPGMATLAEKMKPLLITCLHFLIVAASLAAPNIIVIVADDLRWDTLGYMGNRIIQTPHLDEMARRGAHFRNHFVTSSICNVSRATMFSGQYLRRHGILEFNMPFKPEQWSRCY